MDIPEDLKPALKVIVHTPGVGTMHYYFCSEQCVEMRNRLAFPVEPIDRSDLPSAFNCFNCARSI